MAGAAWFTYPFDNPAGKIEPFGGFAKPDSNVQCPDGTPITALLPGVITGLNGPNGQVQAWGAVVTIKLDKPINSIATHMAYLHLQPLPKNLAIGQHVNAGQVIGYSGGSKAAGSQKVPLGVALYNGDNYGNGPTWNQYLGNPALNPYSLLTQAKNGTLGLPLVSSTTTPQITDVVKNANISLAPTADVTSLLWALDQLLDITNPFNVQNVQQDSIAGVSFTDFMDRGI